MNAPLQLSYRNAHHNAYRRHEPALLVAREQTSTTSETPPTSSPQGLDPATVGDWTHVHRRITELGAERAGHEHELCRWLLAAERLAVFARVGYASLAEYAERMVGLNPRETEERLRVARARAGRPRRHHRLPPRRAPRHLKRPTDPATPPFPVGS